MTTHRRGTIVVSAPAVAAVAVLLSACASPVAADLEGPAAGAPTSVTHVHAIDVDTSRELVTIATHEGLMSIDISANGDPGSPPTVLGDYRGDVMGFVRADDRFLVSGHPPAGDSGPANVGVLDVDLGARAWDPLALSGDVDFHAMSRYASGSSSLIVGLDSVSGAAMTSDDDGVSWMSGVAIPARDVAVVPGGQVLVVTTESGPQLSSDRGVTWSPVEGAPILVLVEVGTTMTGEQAVFGVDVEGTLHRSADGRDWEPLTALPFFPDALGVGEFGALVIANTERAMLSTDEGSTWSQIADMSVPLAPPAP